MTIEDRFATFNINFNDLDTHERIHPEAGWYFFKTNMPIHLFSQLKKTEDSKAYDLAKRVLDNKDMHEMGYIITPDSTFINTFNKRIDLSENEYICYMGTSKNLKKAVEEHINGPDGISCLALSKYDMIKEYKWIVGVHRIQDEFAVIRDNKKKRKEYEHKMIAELGFPILCR